VILASLIGPFARPQRAFDKDLPALAQIFLCDVAMMLIEDHDAVPFDAFLALAAPAIGLGFIGCHAQIDDLLAVLSRADFRVSAQVSH